jgi:hypothetical protein
MWERRFSSTIINLETGSREVVKFTPQSLYRLAKICLHPGERRLKI